MLLLLYQKYILYKFPRHEFILWVILSSLFLTFEFQINSGISHKLYQSPSFWKTPRNRVKKSSLHETKSDNCFFICTLYHYYYMSKKSPSLNFKVQYSSSFGLFLYLEENDNLKNRYEICTVLTQITLCFLGRLTLVTF